MVNTIYLFRFVEAPREFIICNDGFTWCFRISKQVNCIVLNEVFNHIIDSHFIVHNTFPHITCNTQHKQCEQI